MEKLFPAKASLADKISYYFLLSFLASLPFDRFYSHLILIGFCLHTIFHFKKGKRASFTLSEFLMLISVFMVTVLSTIYTINSKEAFNEWGKQVTILLFPIVFWISNFDLKKYRDSLLFGFSIVCFVTTAFLYLNALYIIHYFHLPLSTLVKTPFVNHNFSQPIDMHATFLSMQLIIALVYFFSLVLKEQKLLYRLFYIGSIILLFGGIVQLSSKSVFFCLLIAIDVLIPVYLLKGKQKRVFTIIAYSTTIIFLAVFLSLAKFRERYVTDLKIDLTEVDQGGFTSESRLTRWAIVTDVAEQAPILGHGAGSELGLLHEAFWKKKYYSSFLYNLNSHNEYLSFIVKSGFVGLLVYLVTLASGFYLAIKRRDFFFVLFMLVIIIVSLSENILDVDKGIIFYAFFFSFFLFAGQSDDEKTMYNRDNFFSLRATNCGLPT